jgi:hypothetical protein
MPVESAADLAAFFNPDEFGTAAVYRPPLGAETGVIGILVSEPDTVADFGEGSAGLLVRAIEIQVSAMSCVPEENGLFFPGTVVNGALVARGDCYRINQPPQTDEMNRLIYRCQCEHLDEDKRP